MTLPDRTRADLADVLDVDARACARRIVIEAAGWTVVTIAVVTTILGALGSSVSTILAFWVLLFPVVVGTRLAYLALGWLAARDAHRVVWRHRPGRAVTSLLAAYGVVTVAQAAPSLWLVIEALQTTAPADATLAGYVDGVFFVGGMMMLFDPALREAVTIGLPALVVAGVLEIGRRGWHRYTTTTRSA